MNWIVAGLIGGVGAYLADWLMWGRVFTKGMDQFATPSSPEEMKRVMAANLPKAAVLALIYGVLFAGLYRRFTVSLWVPPGPLAGMELATVLWLPILLASLGSGIWYDRARALLNATVWSWLVRMNVAGLIVALLPQSH
jgi:hypothetical protein